MINDQYAKDAIWTDYIAYIQEKPMPSFTAKHYTQIADMVQEQRKIAIDAPEQLGNGITRNARLEQINSITLAMCKLFAKDNPKFKEMTFIAACNRELADHEDHS